MKSYQTSLKSIFYLPLQDALKDWRLKHSNHSNAVLNGVEDESCDFMELGHNIHLSVAEMDTMPEESSFPFSFKKN